MNNTELEYILNDLGIIATECEIYEIERAVAQQIYDKLLKANIRSKEIDTIFSDYIHIKNKTK